MTEKENQNNNPDGIYGEYQTYDFTTDGEFYKNIFSKGFPKKIFQITKKQKILLFFLLFLFLFSQGL